ncbi:hypothetical protein [Thalassotalea piscium]|uniref:Uncharacterized protein n=1 Tax=Thalassotalea piscium TaxID=1230533 RepID=A0A7X0TUV8_9GAMM|nr:hypothetical protein [Thalassotalea piscium]MBB6544802.1 hypothetical protein [Thalassotalea piscium]
MNIITKLENRVSLAKGRSYLSGTVIAEEIVEVIKKDGFSVFEVIKKHYGTESTVGDVETKIFMTKQTAINYAESEAERLCSINPEFEQFSDGISLIEIENTRKNKVVYVFEIEEKGVH